MFWERSSQTSLVDGRGAKQLMKTMRVMELYWVHYTALSGWAPISQMIDKLICKWIQSIIDDSCRDCSRWLYLDRCKGQSLLVEGVNLASIILTVMIFLLAIIFLPITKCSSKAAVERREEKSEKESLWTLRCVSIWTWKQWW